MTTASSAPAGRPPRVVLFRANPIDTDSRAKKFALTLARLGYDVHVLSGERPETATDPRHLGPVAVHPVVLPRTQRDLVSIRIAAKRRRRFRFIDPTPSDEYVTQVAELKAVVRGTRERADAVRYPQGPEGPATGPGPEWAVRRAVHEGAKCLLVARRARWKAQWAVNVGHRLLWREWDRRRTATALLATTGGVLPEVEDYATAFAKVLDDLGPDVIHAHHPLVLGTAVRAARRIRARGGSCRVLYDARENFAGIPAEEQGHVRRHAVLVREEARYVREADAVLTVSEPIADELQRRYALPRRPDVVLNVPVGAVPDGEPWDGVRAAAGLAAEVPLLVYSGAVSRARGIETLVRALAHLPGVHLALVTVPFPHPQVPDLLQLAGDLGVADRIHPLPPVGQERLLGYLAEADVAVHPMPGGSPNHDQALPNKLFEYLHAGLPLVVSDAKLMASFVRDNGLGAVFRSGDPEGLAAAVRTVLDPAWERPAREELVGRYSWQRQEELIAGVYARLAPPPAGVPAPDPAFPDLAVQDGPVPAAEPVSAPAGERPTPSDPAPVPAGDQPRPGSAAAGDRDPSSTVNRGPL